MTGDPKLKFRAHIAAHIQQLNRKRQMAMGQQQASGVPGAPGPSVAGPAKPGMAGTPRPGAMPGLPRAVQGPPGTIHHDNLADGQLPGRG
jgi:hypothetical protein